MPHAQAHPDPTERPEPPGGPAARPADGSAFDERVKREMPRLLGTAIRLLGPGFSAEEAVAEALAKAFVHYERFRGDSRFGTWVHRILYRVVADRYRERARERRHLERVGRRLQQQQPAPGEGHRAPSLDAHLIGLELDHELREALTHLPETQQIVLLLHAWEGLSLREVATVLGRRYATVKSNLHHARKRLREELGWEQA